MMKKVLLATLSLALAWEPSVFLAQQKMLDVPYVPTKYPVVDEMLRLAGVQRSDVVYDLGCGDGRLVVTAAQRYGARGVGFDIDPERIAESVENATKAGVTGFVKFHEQDLFTADFREATVMTLYLLTSVNLRLRPKLLRELRPGTRIVSHNFGMGEWKPDATTSVDVEDISHEVYLWIIPANISGTWAWSQGKKPVNIEMAVEQSFQHPTAKAKTNGKEIGVRDLSLRGDEVKFVLDLPYEDKVVPMSFGGKVLGHSLAGTIKFTSAGKETVWEWKAKRNPATEKAIDVERASQRPFNFR